MSVTPFEGDPLDVSEFAKGNDRVEYSTTPESEAQKLNDLYYNMDILGKPNEERVAKVANTITLLRQQNPTLRLFPYVTFDVSAQYTPQNMLDNVREIHSDPLAYSYDHFPDLSDQWYSNVNFAALNRRSVSRKTQPPALQVRGLVIGGNEPTGIDNDGYEVQVPDTYFGLLNFKRKNKYAVFPSIPEYFMLSLLGSLSTGGLMSIDPEERHRMTGYDSYTKCLFRNPFMTSYFHSSAQAVKLITSQDQLKTIRRIEFVNMDFTKIPNREKTFPTHYSVRDTQR